MLKQAQSVFPYIANYQGENNVPGEKTVPHTLTTQLVSAVALGSGNEQSLFCLLNNGILSLRNMF